jgi:hypothetical protein
VDAGTILLLVALAVAAIAVAWLSIHLWFNAASLQLRGAAVVAALVSLVCAGAAATGVRGLYELFAPRPTLAAQPGLSASAYDLNRGEHLAYLCARCLSLSDNLPRSGGTRNFLASPDQILGDLFAPNLTPGGPVSRWSDGENCESHPRGD